MFLAATLALSGWLAYEAVAAARSHREAAESAVRDYARVAAWEYARRSAKELDDLIDELYDEVPRRRRGQLPALSEVRRDLGDALHRVGCDCPALESPALLFRLDLRSLEVVGAGNPPATQLLRPLAKLLGVVAADRSQGLVLLPAGRLLPGEAVLTYALVADSGGPALAYLAAFDATAFGAIFENWYRSGGLLPRAIIGDLPNDSLVQIGVRAPGGATLYESIAPYPDQLLAADTMSAPHGGLIVEAAIPPDAVSRLIIGGMPRSRLWLILGLLVLTLGVGAAAVVQMQRDRQLARLREDFISGVSHELRTPLAQIRMFAELQAGGKLRTPEEHARAVAVINREAQRLSHLVENILGFSRLRRAGERTAVRDVIEVAETVSEVLEGFRSLALGRRMSLHSRVPAGLAVVVNRDALHQVLVNLLDNAVKYGPAGQDIAVMAGRRGERVWLAVEDAGPGVPAADRIRIWQPYVRLQRDIEARLPGTGIGLAVVGELLAANGGKAFVEDAPGRGARFVVELPAAPTEALTSRAGAPAEVCT